MGRDQVESLATQATQREAMETLRSVTLCMILILSARAAALAAGWDEGASPLSKPRFFPEVAFLLPEERVGDYE